jgi:hypothetical protein
MARLVQKELLDNMSTAGYIPPQLGEAELRKLLLEALDSAPDVNPETNRDSTTLKEVSRSMMSFTA